MMRALHQTLDDDPKLLVDPIAPRLIDAEGEAIRGALADLAVLPPAIRSRFRSLFLVRNRYAEDCLAESISHGMHQYVILGAGLDTFAYRQPRWANSLRVFEVDHPITQQWQRGRLAAARISTPANVSWIPVDFENETLGGALSKAAFDFTAPAFFSLLGVSQYLSEVALDLTLQFVLSMPATSEIVLTFVLPEDARPADEAALVAAFAVRSGEMGEPWVTQFLPEELLTKLRAMGFSNVFHLSPADAGLRYFRDRRDGLNTWVTEQMMKATV